MINKSIHLFLTNLVLNILEMEDSLQKQGLGKTENIHIHILEDKKWNKFEFKLFCESGTISPHLKTSRKVLKQ